MNKNQDRRQNVNASAEENYFSSLAKKYKKASRIIYILLAAVFVITLVFNSRLLTYTNFNYLFRDINAAAEAAGDNYNSISYTNDDARVVKNYRGGVITVSSSDVAIYTATGRRTMFTSESFVSPQVTTSKKYAIAYEQGGKKYCVYSSFAKVGGETLKYPISYATVADNGWFAIVTKDAEHASVVYLYDDDMQLRGNYSFASATVFMVAMNESGNRLAIFKTETAIDKFSTSVMVVEPGKKTSVFDVTVSNGIVCGGGFTEAGKLQLVSTDGYYLIDASNGGALAHTAFDRPVSRVSVTSDGCAVALSNNSGEVNNTLLAFDKNGKQIYNSDIAGGILDMEYFEGCIFLNQGNVLSKITLKSGDVSSIAIYENGSDIIVYNGNNILLCCQTKAKYIKI